MRFRSTSRSKRIRFVFLADSRSCQRKILQKLVARDFFDQIGFCKMKFAEQFLGRAWFSLLPSKPPSRENAADSPRPPRANVIRRTPGRTDGRLIDRVPRQNNSAESLGSIIVLPTRDSSRLLGSCFFLFAWVIAASAETHQKTSQTQSSGTRARSVRRSDSLSKLFTVNFFQGAQCAGFCCWFSH